MPLAEYAYTMEGDELAPTPESVSEALKTIESRLSELRIDANGKTPILIPASTPQWMIDQINASKIAYAISQYMPVKP